MHRIIVTILLAGIAAIATAATHRASWATVPRPDTVVATGQADVALASIAGIVCPTGDAAMHRNAAFLADYVAQSTGLRLPLLTTRPGERPVISLELDAPRLSPEAYRITATPDGIAIAGGAPQGVFYGIQTLRKALPLAAARSIVIPSAIVSATPRFAYRGMHLDVSRHFFGKEMVKEYLDILALHGINTFHWHLSDDQGWRIEIAKWPRLTQEGSRRPRTVIGRNAGIYDNVPVEGYYTRDDIREVVAYAAARYITVIPEIDMPGHMRAALAAYPELGCTGGPYTVAETWGVFDEILCGGNDTVYQFLRDVLDELTELFPSPYIHLGGDEAPKSEWERCPRCRAKIAQLGIAATGRLTAENQLQGHMVRMMSDYLKHKGRRLIGWDEILECGVDSSAVVMSWRDYIKDGADATAAGHDVIMAPNSTMYFDHNQLPAEHRRQPLVFGGYSPLSKVYAYEPCPATMPAERQRHVIGVQANLWAEYIAYRELAHYQLLPRLAALSEVQWAQPQRKDYADFLARLPRLLDIYRACGWRYCPHDIK